MIVMYSSLVPINDVVNDFESSIHVHACLDMYFHMLMMSIVHFLRLNTPTYSVNVECNLLRFCKINKFEFFKNGFDAILQIFTHRRHSIFEYFLPDGFEIGNLARNKSNARFISRILVLSRSHAVFLYSRIFLNLISITRDQAFRLDKRINK